MKGSGGGGKLSEPFAWRSPKLVFVNSMSDVFQAGVPDWPGKDVDHLSLIPGITRGPDGFFLCRECFRHPHDATREGVFLAGCATGVKPIRNS